jgi:hypothetical protein
LQLFTADVEVGCQFGHVCYHCFISAMIGAISFEIVKTPENQRAAKQDNAGKKYIKKFDIKSKTG